MGASSLRCFPADTTSEPGKGLFLRKPTAPPREVKSRGLVSLRNKKMDGFRHHSISNQEITYHGQCSEEFHKFSLCIRQIRAAHI